MRQCAALRRSSATCRHEFIRLYSSATQPPQHDHDATNERSESFSIDPDGKTVKTAVGDLPLSPVMDPTFWEARDRFKQQKPKPGKLRNVFERRFQKNPFAQALATPVRYDSMTRLRLPSFFLQDFNVVLHPETGKPWWVSKSLALHQPPAEDAAAEADDAVAEVTIEDDMGGVAEAAVDLSVKPVDLPGPQDAVSSATQSNEPPESTSAGPSTYVLARQDVIKSMAPVKKSRRNTAPEGGNSEFYRKFFGSSNSKFKPLGAKAIWREDMDQFVLQQMREQVVQDILYLSMMCETDKRYYIVKCFGWDDVKFKHKGAVLWFGHDSEQVKPGPFSTFDLSSEKGKVSLVVHNMPMLLGQELADKVKMQGGVLQDGSIFMLAGRRTTDLQLRLWKLQGYIYDFNGLLMDASLPSRAD
ncbi:hypothetical protein PFICI_11165 [Pestalotiopsis fici W106-1]|uniref:Uncharacterized protein n=1 Tax=Pestalotiopsis fici (strain W106-1 / CGMCC3.15140) TaxID=1229662 RepID=W3WWP7_PESFW|nr:uncharacterized protein PFICI_11165 [Pestalotiopsis fici W106-1]ETS77291.1 hypothetical protein PFICI_11165 [Pestalotiopsis fici W106-1]